MAAGIALFLLAVLFLARFYFASGDVSDIMRGDMVWKRKSDEAVTRLLAVPLLLYHNIDGKGEYSIDLGNLDAHFRLLKERKIGVASLDDFARRLGNPRPYDGRMVVLSFDDGYMSMYTRLLPLMEAYGYPVTLFVYTDIIYRSARNNLTWKHLREMDARGLNIQSHSQGHPDLVRLAAKGTLESRYRLFEEIYLSKRILELYLDREVLYFAFPYGSYNLELVELCRNAGYLRVFSTDYGPNIITRNNYCLRRRHIRGDYPLQILEELVQ